MTESASQVKAVKVSDGLMRFGSSNMNHNRQIANVFCRTLRNRQGSIQVGRHEYKPPRPPITLTSKSNKSLKECGEDDERADVTAKRVAKEERTQSHSAPTLLTLLGGENVEDRRI